MTFSSTNLLNIKKGAASALYGLSLLHDVCFVTRVLVTDETVRCVVLAVAMANSSKLAHLAVTQWVEWRTASLSGLTQPGL